MAGSTHTCIFMFMTYIPVYIHEKKHEHRFCWNCYMEYVALQNICFRTSEIKTNQQTTIKAKATIRKINTR